MHNVPKIKYMVVLYNSANMPGVTWRGLTKVLYVV